jgi:hypothetical protein
MLAAMATLVPSSTLDWLLATDEPAARWIALTRVLGRPAGDPDVEAAHRAVLADPGTRELMDRLGDWDNPPPVGGHNSPAYAPNLLGLLADMGVAAGDDPRIDATLEAMLRHSDEAGRLASTAPFSRLGPKPVLSALLCDSHVIADILIRFGRAEHAAVQGALDRMAVDLTATPHGPAWPCLPSNGFRGPGRKGDICPQVTLQALRAISRLPADRRPLPPAELQEAVRTLIRVWTSRGTAKPYLFGHGLAFKTVKWPPYWYNALGMLDAIGRYPDVWRSDDSTVDPADRRAVAELAACLIAYNIDSDGRVTPRSCYRGFEGFSFGQKKRPSPFATAWALAVLRPFEGLATEIAAVDVLALGSSKGGSGTAVGPKLPR